jgi:competence protein ComEC
MGRSSRLALGAIAAAVAAGQIAPSHVAAAVSLSLAAVLLLGEVRPSLRAASALPIVLGAGLIVIRLAAMPAAPALMDTPPDGDGPWRLVVESTGSPREGQQTATLGTPESATEPFRVAASLPRYPIIVPGDRVILEGRIRPRPDSPFGAYLLRIGAVGTLTTRTFTIEPAADDPVRRLESLRQGAADALARVLPEPEAGLAAGIIIGLRDHVDRDLAAAFTTAGVSHVVAISGWNIAIVAAAIAAMTGRLGRRRRSVVTIVAIVAYVAFAGASPSVVRAALMAGVVLLARESGRAGRATAALGWAATLLLVSDPNLIADAGFQLSSLATAGLIAWGTPLTNWIETVGRGRLPGWLAESLGVSLAAQAATLPIILVSFGRLAVLSPLVNLVVVPLVAPAMAAGLVALGGGAAVAVGAPHIVGAVAAAPGWVILRILVGVVEGAASLPFASVTLDAPLDLMGGAIATAGLVGLTWWRRTRRPRGPASVGTADPTRPANPISDPSPARSRRGDVGRPAHRAGVLALIISTSVVGGVVVARPAGIARISVLDVGQGDAILVEGSRGGRMLIDGGPNPDALLVALDRRIPPWDRRIDAVILSHPHEDHVAGLALLLARYHVDRVFEPGMRGPGPGYAAWLRALIRSGAALRLSLAAGDRLAVDEIDLRVLWPLRGQVPAEPPDGGTGINNVSVVLIGQVGERRFLLMGDVEEAIDPTLLEDELPRVDFLKVAHHGSRTATTQAFVDAVRPKVAVASAGAGNPYGHPAAATLERLAESGARVLRTDRDGTVVVGFESAGMTVRTEGARVATASVRTAVARGAREPDRAAAFRCAIPVTAIVPEREPPPSPTGVREPVGRSMTVGYHRTDDGAWARGRRLPDTLPRSPALAAAPLARRGRGGRLARGADRGPRHGRRPSPGRGGGAPPRCGQGAPGRRSGARPPPWRRVGGVADPSRPPGAGTIRRVAPGHAAARRGALPALGGVRVA